MPSLAAGVVRFQKEVFPHKRALFERLAVAKRREALFIEKHYEVELQKYAQAQAAAGHCT